MLKNLWDIAVALIDNISNVWDWMNKPVIIDLPVIDPISFVPIDMLGVGLLTLMLFWFIKELVPLA